MKKLFENKILVILLLTLVLVFNLYVSLKFVFRDKNINSDNEFTYVRTVTLSKEQGKLILENI